MSNDKTTNIYYYHILFYFKYFHSSINNNSFRWGLKQTLYFLFLQSCSMYYIQGHADLQVLHNVVSFNDRYIKYVLALN